MQGNTGLKRHLEAVCVLGPVPDDWDLDEYAAQQSGDTVTVDYEARTVTVTKGSNGG